MAYDLLGILTADDVPSYLDIPADMIGNAVSGREQSRRRLQVSTA